MSNQDAKKVNQTTSLDDLYPILSKLRMTPGWNKAKPSLWKEPRTKFSPMHWSYETAKAALDQAGKWIGTDLAERRNFLLFNLVEDNEYDSVRTMVVAYQMIKPGEHARAHWHTPNAMRLILDAGPGCYTVVNGVKLPMNTGDFLLTPGGCWHSHYNEGEHNAYWIDFLDVPLVHLLEPMFAEEHPNKYQDETSSPREHPYYFSKEMLEESLSSVESENGYKSIDLNIDDSIKTMSVKFLNFKSGTNHNFKTTTQSSIFAVISGSGSSVIEGKEISWSSGDILAIPSWKSHNLLTASNSLLVQVSDDPVLEKLGFLRSK